MSRTNIALIILGPIASAVFVVASWNAVRWFRDLLASQGFSDEASGMGLPWPRSQMGLAGGWRSSGSILARPPVSVRPDPCLLNPASSPREKPHDPPILTRLVSLLLAAGLGLSLAGCERPPDPNSNAGHGDGSVRRVVWSDPDTGCQYHFWDVGRAGNNNYAMALAPRLGSDGKPVCSPLPAAQGGR